MGLFGHMRIHEGGNDCSPDTPSIPTMAGPARSPQTGAPTPTSSIILGTSCTPTMLSPTHNPSISAPTTATTEADTDTADFSCPNCPRTLTSRIGLVGHLRIHRTVTGGPVPGAPTYTLRISLPCPHCTCIFLHCMGLLGQMSVH
ncbi:hypothetical protein SprV_0100165600 [Sparganum proliferum]